MTDPNDSEGSWEFVDKDTDSETSSVASAYDTGLPEERDEPSQTDEDLVGSAWNDKDEFVTDSDIEACAEDPAESDNEPDAVAMQAEPYEPRSEHDEMSESMQKSDEGNSSSPETLTGSVLSHDGDIRPDMVEDNKQELRDISNAAELKTNHMQNVDYDDSIEEVVTSPEDINASLNGDITHVTELEPAAGEAPLSNVSSHSDFERVASSSDLATSDTPTEPEGSETSTSTEDWTGQKTVDLSHRDQSDDGSVDFTVIAAPASPPAEVVSQETETTEISEDDTLPAIQGTVDMVTEIQQSIQEKVDAASGPDGINQKTVGMVTDHTAPPNQRLLISIMMISFGVGFLVGRFPVPSSTVLFQHEERHAPIEKTEFQNPPKPIQHIYREEDQPSEQVDTSFEYADSLMSALSKAHTANDIVRFRQMVENSKLRSRNRCLRSSIRKLKSENYKIVTKLSAQDVASKDLAMTMGLMKQTCQKQQRISELNLANKQKEVQQVQVQLEEAKNENTLLNLSLTFCKKLRQQHSELLDVQKSSDEEYAVERANFHDRLQGMRLRLQRYRKESKGLIQQLKKEKTRSFYLGTLVQQNDILRQQWPVRILEDGQMVSPLVEAIARKSQTCNSWSKSRSQVRWLRSKLRGQRSVIGRMEQEGKLKAMALEMLYNTMGELRNYATCLKQQILLLPPERAIEASAICRATSKDVPIQHGPSLHQGGPKCFYPINGTLAVDFSSMNITLLASDHLPSHELKLLSDKVKPTLIFNSTSLVTSVCDLSFDPNVTSDPSDHLVPRALYAQVLKRNSDMQHDLEVHAEEYSSLQKVCESNNHSLEVSIREKENVENQLVVVKSELRRIRKEKKELNRKLHNATTELKNKSSIRNCLKSAMNTNEILRKVNGSKAYKAASKMAEKVQKAGANAWKKLKKFASKFGSSEHHDDFWDDGDDDDDGRSHEFRFDDEENGGKKKQKNHHESNDARKQRGKRERRKQKHQRETDSDHTKVVKKERKQKGHEFNKTPDDAGKKRKTQPNIREFNTATTQKRGKQEEEAKNHGGRKDKRHLKGFSKKKRKHDESKHKKDMPKSFDPSDKRSGPENIGQVRNGKHHKILELKRKKAGKKPSREGELASQKPEADSLLFIAKTKEEGETGEKYFFNHAHVKKSKKDFRSHEINPGLQDRKEVHGYGATHRRHGNNFGDKLRRFGEAIKNRLDAAKKYEEEAANQLMPIYDKWQKVYCEIEKKVTQKSFSEIWESVSKMADWDDKTEKSGGEFVESEGRDSESSWHWNIYQNLTDLLLPVIEIPGKLELPVWGMDDQKLDWVETATPDPKSDSEKESVGGPEDVSDGDNLRDPQWFTHMFEGRELLRKDLEESALSEEEFDWFLRMFESREELRRSGEGEYRISHHSNHDDQDLDWFLKMFEERARLRFENSEEKKNWYLRMFEERDKARSQMNYETSEGRKSNWYAKMFKAREKMRRQVAKYRGASEEWCQA